MALLMDRHSRRTWLTTVANTGQLYPAVAGSGLNKYILTCIIYGLVSLGIPLVSSTKIVEPNKSEHNTCASSFIWLQVWESQVECGLLYYYDQVFQLISER